MHFCAAFNCILQPTVSPKNKNTQDRSALAIFDVWQIVTDDDLGKITKADVPIVALSVLGGEKRACGALCVQ